MRKIALHISLTLLLALLPVGFTLAQTPLERTRSLTPPKTQTEKLKALKEFKEKYPLLAKQRELAPRTQSFPSASLPAKGIRVGKRHAVPLYANSNATIWVNLHFEPTWTEEDYGPFGYYSFSPSSPIVFNSIFPTDKQDVAMNGVQYADGHIYGLSIDASRVYEEGMTYEYLYDTDTQTGETTETELDFYSQLNLAATETAQAEDGTVYGEFYTSDGSGHEWGTVDYRTQSRTTIATATNTYVALGITKAGQLYGVASDGNLYKISKETGEETLVGATGLTLADSEGNYYTQTGEIDQRDDTFYWYAIDANTNCGLYEVDIQTGKATLIANKIAQVYGMVIQTPPANDAPAKVTDLTLTFNGSSHDGEVSFHAPEKTYSGSELNGELNYAISDNGTVTASGTTTPGAIVTKDITVETDGVHLFAVTTANSAGESQRAMVRKYIGKDTPLPVTSLNAVPDSMNNKKVTLTWTALNRGVNAGDIDKDSLTFNIFRTNDDETVAVASGVAGDTYTDVIPDAPVASYVYGVQAQNGDNKSSITWTTGKLIIGDPIDRDWSTDFSTVSEWNGDLYTVVDANGDGSTWTFGVDAGPTSNPNYFTGTEGNDDWLFTPAFKFEKKYVYTLTFRVHNEGNRADNNKNTLEVMYGKGDSIVAMTNTIWETMTPPNTPTVYRKEIHPAEDGVYNIGFHDNTVSLENYALLIDSIAVVRSASADGPDSVTSLKVVPAEKGALNATLSFNVATKLINNDIFAKADSVEIIRNGENIATLTNKSAGEGVVYTDNSISANGNYNYKVVAYVGESKGRTAEASAFVGKDKPAEPQNALLVDNGTDIIAKWDKASEVGKNSGYVNTDEVTVSLFNVDETYAKYGFYDVADSITTSVAGGTSAVISRDPSVSNDSVQKLYFVFVRANNSEGSSDYVSTSPIVTGQPITLPYKETLNGGKTDNGFAWTEGNDQHNGNSYAAGWTINTQSSQDNDGGSIIWAPYSQERFVYTDHYYITAGDETSINTPKISLGNASNPKLFFYMNAIKNDSARLKVLVATPDGVEHEAAEYDLMAEREGWNLKSVDLSGYSSERYIIVKFRGVATGGNVSVGIDNINVFDQLEHNLKAMKIITPNNVRAGGTGKVIVTVLNQGADKARDYSVVLYADNQPVDTVTVDNELDIMATDTVALSLPVAANRKDDVKVSARVVYVPDVDLTDNSTSTNTVNVKPSEYVSVDDLSAHAEEGSVSLAWTKPIIPAPTTVVDDFESYEPFATEFGDWTLVEGNKGIAGGLLGNISYPGEGTAFAYDIFNPNAVTTDFNVIEEMPDLKPHSGNQFAGAPYKVDPNTGSVVNADDWIISPILSGKKQTVKFYVFNVTQDNGSAKEAFDVLYSVGTEPWDTTQFVKIRSDVADGNIDNTVGANWKEIAVEIPDNAQYFAIHHNTEAMDAFLFGIDDISYEKGIVGANDSIIAYNVYRDGEKVGSVNGGIFTFTDDKADEGSHIYNVTVVYQSKSGDINESGFSNDASITVTGIDTVEANAESKYDVYTIDGKAVRLGAKSLNGLTRGVYIINDRKYVIK